VTTRGEIGGVFAGIVSQAAPKGTDGMSDGWFVAPLPVALFGAFLIVLAFAAQLLGGVDISMPDPMRISMK
jgi:hypothetical protein